MHCVSAQRPVLRARAAGPCLRLAPARSSACAAPREQGQVLSSSQLSPWAVTGTLTMLEAPTTHSALDTKSNLPSPRQLSPCIPPGAPCPTPDSLYLCLCMSRHSSVHHNAALPVQPRCSLHRTASSDGSCLPTDP